MSLRARTKGMRTHPYCMRTHTSSMRKHACACIHAQKPKPSN